MALCGILGAPRAEADASVALAGAGQMERVGQTQDALRNPSAASFGAPTTDDRRLFKLRWRMPWLMVGGGGGPGAFVSGFTNTGFALPPGLSLLGEPTDGLSALVPHVAVGEPRKLGQVQLGALSTTLGHGSLVDRYTNAPEGAPRRLGLLLEGNLAGIGAQALTGDLGGGELLAARVYGRPIMWFAAPDATFQPNELDVDPRTELTGIWVAGVSVAADMLAPSAQAGGPRPVVAVGLDNEAALLDNQLVKAIPHLDLNLLAGAGQPAGFGAHPGVLWMLDVAGVRLDGDANVHIGTDGYQPAYFDRLYALERDVALGADKPKADVDRPASWGYRLRMQGGFNEMLTAFAQASDAFPLDASRGEHAGAVTVGASGFAFFFGGSVTATQTGITDYANIDWFGRGFVVTAEGRVALAANIVHLVGRWWRAHLPLGAGPDDMVVTEGTMLGLELNLDVL